MTDSLDQADHQETGRPAWWKWFRLREGRTLYKSVVTVQHTSGSTLTVTIEGKDPALVSTYANMLRTRHKPRAAQGTTL